MIVLCIEGPSAAGKSTLATALAEALDGVVIREANELFERPAAEPEDWYLNQQVERWRLATAASESGRIAILDGDVFQPQWYEWAHGFQTYQPLTSLARFYRREHLRTVTTGSSWVEPPRVWQSKRSPVCASC